MASETICGYEVHPACALLPMMPAAALTEMAEDIRRHGQRQPIHLFEGRVLDGRNRLKACELAGVEPEVREWSGGDPVRWVLSLNFHRRHLSDDQKSVVGARAASLLMERAAAEAQAESAPTPGEARPGEGADAAPTDVAQGGAEVAPDDEPLPPVPVPRHIERQAQESAAAMVNVSTQRIARGRKLLERAVPSLVDAVERGALSMTQAQQVASLERDAQEALVGLGEAAVIEEVKRLRDERRAARPSFQRALADLDLACAEWTLSKSRDGHYRLEGLADHGPIDAEAERLKDAVMKAWTVLHDAT